MLILPFLLFSINPSAIRHAPAGTEVHIRLTTTVGSYASRAGTSVSAVLIAPVRADGETVLPAGSVVSGSVKRAARGGLGIRHETASLDLEFNQVLTTTVGSYASRAGTSVSAVLIAPVRADGETVLPSALTGAIR